MRLVYHCRHLHAGRHKQEQHKPHCNELQSQRLQRFFPYQHECRHQEQAYRYQVFEGDQPSYRYQKFLQVNRGKQYNKEPSEIYQRFGYGLAGIARDEVDRRRGCYRDCRQLCHSGFLFVKHLYRALEGLRIRKSLGQRKEGYQSCQNKNDCYYYSKFAFFSHCFSPQNYFDSA